MGATTCLAERPSALAPRRVRTHATCGPPPLYAPVRTQEGQEEAVRWSGLSCAGTPWLLLSLSRSAEPAPIGVCLLFGRT